MSNIWDKFDDAYDTKKLSKTLAESEKNGEFEELPHDTYEVEINKLELGVSKENKPKLVCWFKIVAGKYKNRLIFMNQALTEPFLIHKANKFLRSLDSGIEINFETFSQYSNLLKDVHEKITAEKLEYQLKYSKNGNYDEFEITEVYQD